jgi:Asp-tRNA(Asn)/Glu-tRNA(Gln) amidotransferase A subunit family amidase
VADDMVPLALGSQTAASLIRPASYCGVVGYKPTYGRFSLAGVSGLAQSLDTLGWLARSVQDVALLRAALSDGRYTPVDDEPGSPPRIGLCHTPEWDHAEPATRAALADAARRLERAGAVVSEVELPPLFSRLAEAQKIVMAYETAHTLADERLKHRAALSAPLRELIDEGIACSYADYLAAARCGAQGRAALAEIFDGLDCLLAPSAPGEAPPGLAATGDPIFSRMWTLLHLPAISLPGLHGPAGLPVGVQLLAAADEDERLLSVAAWAMKQLA